MIKAQQVASSFVTFSILAFLSSLYQYMPKLCSGLGISGEITKEFDPLATVCWRSIAAFRAELSCLASR